MRKSLITYIYGIFVVLCILIIIYLYSPWIILPTNSSPGELTIVDCGYPVIKKITMNHYINDELKNKYVLELKVGTTYQNSQKYDIPKVSEGIIEINVELADGVVSGNNSTITINSFAGNIQTKGLLIYVTTIYSTAIYINGFVYYDQYIDFVSGKEHITYIEKAGETQWLQTKNAPKLKKIVKESMSYISDDNRWKENKWIKVPIIKYNRES